MRASWRIAGWLVVGALAATLVGPGAADSDGSDGVSGAGNATAPARRVQPPKRTFTVAAVGDFLSEGLVNIQAAAAAPPGVRFDYEPLLRPVEPIIAAADLAICHMETPIGAPGAQVGFAGKNAYGTNNIAAAAELPGDLARLGFDRCSTASNHANDLGADGVRTTLEALDGAGLSHTGTARSAEEATPRVLDVAGVRVGHVSFARNSNTGFPAEWWRVRQGVSAGNVIDDVAALRAAGAEVVIVSLHVYVEMQNLPTAEDRAVVRDIVAGAHPDLIIIHGPHVVQPVERVDGTLVFWSLGNFISGMGVPNRDKYSDPRTLDGLLASVRFSERADGTWQTEPWTVLLCNVVGSRVVYPGLTTLLDPATPPGVRGQLDACVARSTAVVADLK